jgi:hypothetical protein
MIYEIVIKRKKMIKKVVKRNKRMSNYTYHIRNPRPMQDLGNYLKSNVIH